MKIKGACHCGRCSYEVSDDARIDVANCHCRVCRQSTGGTFVTWATVLKKLFRWTGETPKCYRSSKTATRYFCGRCGAQLALFTSKSPDTIDLTVTTFTHPERYPPMRHIWVCDQLAWVELGESLEQEKRENIQAANKGLKSAVGGNRGTQLKA